MTSYDKTPRTTLRRIPDRGTYDRAAVHAILDEALVCHLGFVVDGQPFVIPTFFVREGDVLYVHGAAASRALKVLASGGPACVTVTLLDGLVLARSAFHHSMNYRSVVVLGATREVLDHEEKQRVLAAFVEKVSAGRSAEARPANDKELAATRLLAMDIVEASAKVRTGPPKDDEEDADIPIWAGVVPLRPVAGPPVPDGDMRHRAGPPVPAVFAPR